MSKRAKKVKKADTVASLLADIKQSLDTLEFIQDLAARGTKPVPKPPKAGKRRGKKK